MNIDIDRKIILNLEYECTDKVQPLKPTFQYWKQFKMNIINVLAHPLDRIQKFVAKNIGAQTPLNYVSHKPQFISKVPKNYPVFPKIPSWCIFKGLKIILLTSLG